MIPVTAVLITREAEWPKDIRMDFPFAETLIQTRCPNVRRRFELAVDASYDTIYVQDDDVIVDIAALWEKYDGRLTNAITDYHSKAYAGTGVTLVGWGAFFPRKLVDFTRWEKRYGEVDPMEADRIFTYLAQPHNTHVMPIREIRRGGMRMCHELGHYAIRDRIIAQLKQLETSPCASL